MKHIQGCVIVVFLSPATVMETRFSLQDTNIQYYSDIYIHFPFCKAREVESEKALGGFTDVCLEMTLLNYSGSDARKSPDFTMCLSGDVNRTRCIVQNLSDWIPQALQISQHFKFLKICDILSSTRMKCLTAVLASKISCL